MDRSDRVRAATFVIGARFVTMVPWRGWSCARVTLALMLASFGAGACQERVVEPVGVADGCPARPDLAVVTPRSDLVLSDFEDGSQNFAHQGGRDGLWQYATDDSAIVAGFDVSTRCAARGLGAAHVYAERLQSWGANLSGYFHPPPGGSDQAVPYDLGPYHAVVFYGASSGASGVQLRVGVSTTDTTSPGGTCKNCGDFYGETIVLTPRWQRFVIEFSDLRQIGFGDPQTPLHLDRAAQVVFQMAASFDFWIDDVALLAS